MQIEIPDDLRFLDELYFRDAADAWLLAEYPSSNSDETIFQNKSRFIIYDPFPPPPRELLTTLGPHHLMCCWGNRVPVTSQIAPPDAIADHWEDVFGAQGRPKWKEFDPNQQFITLFPHQSLSAEQQVVDPVVNYELHSKEVIEKINCPQAEVYDSASFPCIAKLSHGYAGLGNFILNDATDEEAMQKQLCQHWSGAKLIFNSVIENIVGDYGIQFYLRSDGSIVWIGLTEQHFNENNRWCGGTYSRSLQSELLEPLRSIIIATGDYLHTQGYFGLVGIDILRDRKGNSFLVDVNPRLTGITPFLLASRIFQREKGYTEGIYRACFRFNGTLDKFFETARSLQDCQVLLFSGIEQDAADKQTTICHISVSSNSQARNRTVLDLLTST